MRIDLLARAAVVILVSATSMAAEPGMVTSALSPETRAVLIREMQAIDGAMDRIHTALVTGDHVTVVKEAQAIHNSLVLAQALSDEQRAEIGALPQHFLAADRDLHRLAEKLANAGKVRDSQAEQSLLAEMTRACLACHKEFAAGRFPGLAPAGVDETNR